MFKMSEVCWLRRTLQRIFSGAPAVDLPEVCSWHSENLWFPVAHVSSCVSVRVPSNHARSSRGTQLSFVGTEMVLRALQTYNKA